VHITIREGRIPQVRIGSTLDPLAQGKALYAKVPLLNLDDLTIYRIIYSYERVDLRTVFEFWRTVFCPKRPAMPGRLPN
jgi:hypothetical protein